MTACYNSLLRNFFRHKIFCVGSTKTYSSWPAHPKTCATHTLRIDATHCYTADEFGKTDSALCWSRHSQEYLARQVFCQEGRYTQSIRHFHPCLWHYGLDAETWPPCATETIFDRNGGYVAARQRDPYRPDEYWPDRREPLP